MRQSLTGLAHRLSSSVVPRTRFARLTSVPKFCLPGRYYSQATAAASADNTEAFDEPIAAGKIRIREDVSKPADDERVANPTQPTDADQEVESLPTWTSYSDRLDPMILETMKDTFRYKTVSKVQQHLLDRLPIKNDVLVRSKTGTGKTLAFLVPALQQALENFAAKGLAGVPLKRYANENASVFIVSPTRELANQIATEARRLVTVPGSNMKALCLVGGDSKRIQLKLMHRERNDFVVGTPGRLVDMLENEPDFRSRVANLQTLILDEADTLLEMGFRPELNKILSYLPKNRQTFMFSATVSKEIQGIARTFMKKDHIFINTVSKDDQDVHQRIKQEYIIRPMEDHMKVVLSLLINTQLQNSLAKVIVFLPTTKMTMLYSSCFKILRRLYRVPTFQQFDIHAQRTQDSRAKVSKLFREAGAGSVLFTTDVSARGVDYPGVTQVIQVGAAQSRDLYVHRVGRTGRAGNEGEGVIVLSPTEAEFLKILGNNLPLVEKDFPDSEIALGPTQAKVFRLMTNIMPIALLDDAFKSIVGSLFPRAREFGQSLQNFQDELTDWYRSLAGLEAQPPGIPPRLLEGGGGRGRSEGSGRNGGGGRSGSNGRSNRSGGYSSRSNLRPFSLPTDSYAPRQMSCDVRGNTAPKREWRPARPYEYLYGKRAPKEYRGDRQSR